MSTTAHRVPSGHEKSLKVLEFHLKNSRPLKVFEIRLGLSKCLKNP